MDLRIEETSDLELVHELRRRILRTGPLAGLPPGSEHDLRPGARHWVAWCTNAGTDVDGGARPVGVCSVVPDDGAFGPGSARLTGMGVVEGARRAGLGSALLQRALCDLGSQWAVVWAHARLAAVPFYERHGFEVRGERYEHLPGVPHRLIVLRPGVAVGRPGP